MLSEEDVCFFFLILDTELGFQLPNLAVIKAANVKGEFTQK